jgi:flagellin-like protein
MKGISTVIAVVLMLMITIALITVASGFIFGLWGRYAGVVLAIHDVTCAPDGPITVTIRNDGTDTSGAVTVTITQPDGSTLTTCNPSITSIPPGKIATTICTGRNQGYGNYKISISSGPYKTTGTVYCSS